MSKKSSAASDLLKPSLSLFMICLICAILLALVQSVTRPVIEARAIQLEEKKRSAMLPAANAFEAVADLPGSGPDESVELINAYRGLDTAGQAVGYVFVLDSNGYAGPIRVICGFDTEAKVTAVSILNANETPGLGAKTSDAAFLDQFPGKGGDQAINVYKGGSGDAAADPNGIDGVASATISSRAVTRAVELARTQSLKFMSQAGKEVRS